MKGPQIEVGRTQLFGSLSSEEVPAGNSGRAETECFNLWDTHKPYTGRMACR